MTEQTVAIYCFIDDFLRFIRPATPATGRRLSDAEVVTTARRDYARAETHWLAAYRKATAAKLDRLRPKYLQQLSTFYDARGRPAEAQRYSRAHMALADTLNAAQAVFHVAQYESEQVEQAKNDQIK